MVTKFFSIQNIFTQNFLDLIFSDPHYFGPKIFETKIFFGPKIFVDPTFFWTQPELFWTKNCEHEIFGTLHFWTQIVWTKKFFWIRIL